MKLTRRRLIELAAAFGASAAWADGAAALSATQWRERRDLYPHGVASGDPHHDSVILWTRRAFNDGRSSAMLDVEVAEDAAFDRVIATAKAPVSSAEDWTCRVLVGGLKPSSVYWYRFTDATGAGSRIGRTITAPSPDDGRSVRFIFVSCQNANLGEQTAYRRMIYEDERARPEDRVEFIMHLGDWIYEIVWYPEDRPQYYQRTVRDIVRYPDGEHIDDFHVPTTVEGYRAIYRAYLLDTDLQDARARWPFISMWDNHEYSWRGFQGMEDFGDGVRFTQTRKVAAMQTFFEYQPARMVKPSGTSLDSFDPPHVVDAPIRHFDENGLGIEPNNLAAISTLRGHRTIHWGSNVDLIITDLRSFRAQAPLDRPEAKPFESKDFPLLFPAEVVDMLEAGRTYNDGKPPSTIRFGDEQVPNPHKGNPPLSMLGVEQKKWLFEQLSTSTATWKIWSSTLATLDFRTDPQNLPPGVTKPWPGSGYASLGGDDWTSYHTERAEIFDFVRLHDIDGFTIVAGDRHSFWAGLASKALPPENFDPVGVEFVVGSISAPGIAEAVEFIIPKNHPLRALYAYTPPSSDRPKPTVNMLVKHGVQSCLEYARTNDLDAARRRSNPDVSPHLSFLDLGGHGYAVVRASAEQLETEFVCIPRPIAPTTAPDGGPLAYRVSHTVARWKQGERPVLAQQIIEGDASFCV